MRAARYGAFWPLAENFRPGRFPRRTLIVADRKSDNKKVSFDRAILFELFMIPLQMRGMQETKEIAGEASYEGAPVEALDYDFNLSKLERVMSGAGKRSGPRCEIPRGGVEHALAGTWRSFGGSGPAEKRTGAPRPRRGGRCRTRRATVPQRRGQ